MGDRSFLARRALLALFLAFTLAWFGSLDYRKLIKPDEGRYAEIAREMAVSGDWVTPRLNGIKYFEKPPLQYWATAAAFRAFGEDEWTARLWAGGTGFFAVLLVFLTGRRLFGPDAGLLAAAALASSLLFLMIGHMNTLDMGLAFFLQLALSGFLFAQRAPRTRQACGWMLLTWAALALAVLSKGVVALALPGAALIAYSLLARDFSPWRRLHLAWGLPLFLLIAAPWFVAVSQANPEFPRFFFIHEHFERFLTAGHRRTQPWWYFLPVLAAGALPWTLVMLQALLQAWRAGPLRAFQPGRFLLVWVAVVFLFFSASGSKLPSYILPVLPALALLAGELLAGIARRSLLLHLGLVAALAAGALLLLTRAAGFADHETPGDMMAGYIRWLTAAAAIWLLGTLAALRLAWKDRLRPACLALAGTAFVAGLGVLLGHEQLGRSNSAHYIAGQIAPQLRAGTPFYSVRMYEQTLPFYLQRTLTLADYRDELGFGQEQEPDKAIATLEAFKTRWLADPEAFAVMTPDTYQELSREGLPMTIAAQDTRRIIVRKPPP